MRLRFKTDYWVGGLLVLQLLCWYHTRSLLPEMTVVPPVPGAREVKALSLGDEQFYFRTLAFKLQNMGDTFGRFTPLRQYDYKRLSQWFLLLDGLDSLSDFVPAIASYYYSQTQYVPDVRYVIQYLEQHVARHPEKKWWWLGQAVYLANHKLEDKQWALKMAYKLAAIPGDLPPWTRQMPAFIHEQLGEKEEALVIIKQLLNHPERFSRGELNFMHYFINERLSAIANESNK